MITITSFDIVYFSTLTFSFINKLDHFFVFFNIKITKKLLMKSAIFERFT